jgi:drug/metabolite transporter (DMT)-like permease
MAESPERNPDRRTLSAFLLVVLFLGINPVAVKFSNQGLAPFWGASVRFMIASAILYSILAARRISLPTGRALTGAVLFGTFAFTINFALLYWALTEVSASLVSVVLATIPLITMVLAALVGLEHITGRGIVGAIIVIAGIGLIFAEQLRFDVRPVYVGAVFVAAASAAASSIVVKYFPRSHPIATNAVGMSIAAVVLLLLSLIFSETRSLPAQNSTWLALGWLVLSSIGGFVLMVWVLSRWSATSTSYVAVLTPLVTISFALPLANEKPSIAFLIGAVIVLAGVYVGALSAPTRGKSQVRENPAD